VLASIIIKKKLRSHPKKLQFQWYPIKKNFKLMDQSAKYRETKKKKKTSHAIMWAWHVYHLNFSIY
jgi:hypothetical protein